VAKRKGGKVIPQSDLSKKITPPQHPSSSSNATDSGVDADIVAGGAASGVASKTAVPSEVTGAADPQASLVPNPKNSSPSRKANEVPTTDSDSVAAIVAGGGGAVIDAASDTPVRSDVARADAKGSPKKKSSTPRKGVKMKETLSKSGWIGTWDNQEQRDPSYHYSLGMTLPPQRESSPRLAKAKFSPSNLTVSSTIITPPIRNSKQDITDLNRTASSGHGTVTTLAPPEVKNAASSSIDDSTSINESSSASAISKDNSWCGARQCGTKILKT
jgi:hypothetical protein